MINPAPTLLAPEVTALTVDKSATAAAAWTDVSKLFVDLDETGVVETSIPTYTVRIKNAADKPWLTPDGSEANGWYPVALT